MATMILLPESDSLTSSHWVVVGAGLSQRWEALEDDNGSTSYVKCNDDNAGMTIVFANPSVAEAGINFDETVSVRFLSSGKAVHRSNPSLVDIAFASPTSGFSESCSYNAHRTNFETINGTARTTHDGSHPWAYANLEALEMLCTKDDEGGPSVIEVYLSYLALEVTYTPTVAISADNATFFGANF